MEGTFIEKFIKHTEESESPTSYFKWAAYAALSATLRDRHFIDLPAITVYPNIYVLILSKRSSVVRKSPPLKLVSSLLWDIGATKIIDGQATIQGIMEMLASPTFENPNGSKLVGASGFLYSEELSAFLVKDDIAIDTLTTLFDYHRRWGRTLRGAQYQLTGVCLSMLAASNEALVREVFNESAARGGLLARTLLVVEEKKRKLNSLMYGKPSREHEYKELERFLREVQKLEGPREMSDPAKAYYDEWYHSFETNSMDTSSSGVEGRLPFNILKVAMLQSVARDPYGIIEQQDVEIAVDEVLALLPNYHSFAASSTKSNITSFGTELIVALASAPNFELKEKKIYWNYWSYGQGPVEETLMTLERAGIIYKKVIGGQVKYGLTEQSINQLPKKVESEEPENETN